VDRVVTALAIVPARGGSRGLPRKNARLLAGHPLIAWSIAAARQAREVGRVLVSTDDPELREIARHYGAEAPFLRPAALAGDLTPDLPVFDHALRWLEEHEGARPDLVVQLRPTSPLRPPGLVDRGVRALRADPHADSLRAVVPSAQNPYKTWRIEGDRLRPLFPSVGTLAEPYNQPRQLLPATFWQTGHLDVARRATVLERGSLTGAQVMPLVVDAAYAVDIDGPEHWREAEELVASGAVACVRPDHGTPAPAWAAVRMVVFDFDGVFTDNRVTVSADGTESVVCSRADGAGIAALRASGIASAVLSAETSGVVSARCRKLGLPCVQGVRDKGPAFDALVAEHGFRPSEVAYVGNDVADLPCLERAGLAVAVADAVPEVRRAAHVVLTRPGGHGAVREACDAVLAAIGRHAEEETWARS
jgi:YrbI family 3-deoxy-D-manno-octulosonate 8-phosphate phosphatase